MQNKLDKLKGLLPKYNLDYYIIPSSDEFQGEYVPPHSARLKFISGFSGSNGLLIVAREGKNVFFTDGRYLLQASLQLEKGCIIEDMSKTSIVKWIADKIKEGRRIGYDPSLHTVRQVNLINKDIAEGFIPIQENLVDIIWQEKPLLAKNNMFIYELKYSGREASAKIGEVQEFLAKNDAGAVILTDPHSICWLFNIRGKALKYTPLVLCYAVVYEDGSSELFLHDDIDEKLLDYFSTIKVKVCEFSSFYSLVQNIPFKVCINTDTQYAIAATLKNYVIVDEPCELPKALKNEVEIAGAINAHNKDGQAVSSFLEWLQLNIETMDLSEISVADKLLEFRKQQEGFFEESFSAIVGFKENGAIIHYCASAETSKPIVGSGLLLIDSGGQYFGGTTDITRTIAIGKPTQEQMHDFTLVLKGHINLASAVFPVGTSGADLDILARGALKEEGKDYAHGTGHGVGSFLSVHEGPHSIGSYNKVPLEPGMILSVEPGFYKEGEYGIRIESLVYVKHSQVKPDHLEFGMLTKVVIDESLVDFSMLSDSESEWLCRYNLWART